MTEPARTIPQPTPVDDLPPPEIPASARPSPPQVVRVVPVVPNDVPELAVVYKRTYTFSHLQPCRLSEEQEPLDEEGALYDEIAEGVAPSYRSLPEVIGYKTGTDVVIQGSARSRQPVPRMAVQVHIGRQYRHSMEVFGRRYCDYIYGRLAFTAPEPFLEMPLRYENAYGGHDDRYEATLVEEVKRITPRQDLRRIQPIAEALFMKTNPLVYPRNRFGKGYILEDRPEAIEGRELPNLERRDDLLTPERLVVGHPLDWAKQPLPVGFDYFDPLSFPRNAMMGLPPASRLPLGEVAEVRRKLIPADYCRGNVFLKSFQEGAGLLHPWMSRCASLDLCLPFLKGDEEVLIQGMDVAHQMLRFTLPRECPLFSLVAQQRVQATLVGKLTLLRIDVDNGLLSMVWVGRTPLKAPLRPDQLQEITENLYIQVEKI